MHTRTIFATFAVLLAPLAAQEKHTLRYDFQPGSTCWTQLDQEMSQSMDMGGQKMDVAMHSSTWMESKVTGVEKGVATITNRYARVKVKSDAPGMNVDYDSDVAGSDPGPLRTMADLVGKVATLQTDVRGKIVAMKMPDGLGPQFEQVAGSLKTGMEQSFVAWPEGPVAIGDTWQTQLEIPMQQMGSMKATVVNKLVAVDGDVIKVGMAMSFDTSKLQMPGGMQMQVKDSTGTMTVSRKSAMPLESSTTMVFEMGMDDSVVMSMTMKQTMKQVPAPAPKAEPKAEPKKDAAGK
jgi:hypothetical protein